MYNKTYKGKTRQRKEESMQIVLSRYIQIKYPDVVFTSESSGIRVPIGVAMRMKKQRSICKLPDLIIDEPRGGYFGLRLELKTIENTPFKLDGSLKGLTGETAIQLRAQAATLDRLKRKGYWAQFAVGINQAIAIVDKYMSLPETKPMYYDGPGE